MPYRSEGSPVEQGSLKPKGYLPRIADSCISRLLDEFGAVEVAGPMWCGKTWTSLSFASSVSRMGRQAERILAQADPSVALLGDQPHAIDEWQDVPAIWDEVRYQIDESGSKPGQFLLTGSSEPNKDQLRHSGAGRIATFRMGTMTFAEMGYSRGEVSLANLFSNSFKPQLSHQTLASYAPLICRGGWPALVGSRQSYTDFIANYLNALFSVSMTRRGMDENRSRRVAQSLARNLGQASKLTTIAEDAGIEAGNSTEASRVAAAYVSTLVHLYIIDEVTGWDAPIRSKSRLRIKPRRYFADPSLAASLLGVTPDRLLMDGQLFGMLFESLVMHDLRIYASALPGATQDSLHYYRDSDGLEVDAILELSDGHWAGIEIKLGENKVDDGISSLVRLRRKIALNPLARNPQPAFMAVVVGAGEAARYDSENDVYVIPFACLGP